jgi:hypothetical protein
MVDLASIIQRGMENTTHQAENIIPMAVDIRDKEREYQQNIRFQDRADKALALQEKQGDAELALSTQRLEQGKQQMEISRKDLELRERGMTAQERIQNRQLLMSEEKAKQEKTDFLDAKLAPIVSKLKDYSDKLEIAEGNAEKFPNDPVVQSLANTAREMKNKYSAQLLSDPRMIAMLKESSFSNQMLHDLTVNDKVWNTYTQEQKDAIADSLIVYQESMDTYTQKKVGIQAKAVGETKKAETAGMLEAYLEAGVPYKTTSETTDKMIPDYAKFFDESAGVNLIRKSDITFKKLDETKAKAKFNQYIQPLSAYAPEFKNLPATEAKALSEFNKGLVISASVSDYKARRDAIADYYSENLEGLVSKLGDSASLPGVTAYVNAINELAKSGKENDVATVTALSKVMQNVFSSTEAQYERKATLRSRVQSAE